MARTTLSCVAVLLAAHCGSVSVPAQLPHCVPALGPRAGLTHAFVGQRMVMHLRGGLVEHELEVDDEGEPAAAEPEMFSRGLGEHVSAQIHSHVDMAANCPSDEVIIG